MRSSDCPPSEVISRNDISQLGQQTITRRAGWQVEITTDSKSSCEILQVSRKVKGENRQYDHFLFHYCNKSYRTRQDIMDRVAIRQSGFERSSFESQDLQPSPNCPVVLSHKIRDLIVHVSFRVLSDRDFKVTPSFCKWFLMGLLSKLEASASFHPETPKQ